MDLHPLRLYTLGLFVSLASATPAFAQVTTPAPDSKSISVIDGALGPCSADFTVTDAAGAPIYNAKVKVHITYGFLQARKLDLEVGTNADGKTRVAGLPSKTKFGLTFHASEGDRSAEVFDDTAKTCQAQFSLKLEKTPPL